MIPLGVAFLATKFGVSRWMIYAVIVFIVVASLVGVVAVWRNDIWNAGYAVCDALWTDKQKDAEIERLKLEISVLKKSEADDRAIDAQTDTLLKDAERVINELREKLKGAGNQCKLGSDAGRMRW